MLTRTSYGYDWWTRYLFAFDRVRVLARVRRVPAVASQWQRADGDAVSFVPIPYYVGPAEYVRQWRPVRRAIHESVGDGDAVIMRVGSPIANCLESRLRRTGHPFALEVLGDPRDVFAPGAIHHPLRPFFRWWFHRSLVRQSRAACAAAYVTSKTLQRRYPCPALEASVSDVDLGPESIADSPKIFRPHGESANREAEHHLIFVGSLEQLYKGPDVLIDAVALCAARGLGIRLSVIGGGRYQPFLEARARRRGVSERVAFPGALPAGHAVRARLDEAALFVLPSRTEGLPRALVEAMARGLPCIGSAVGGIPELLDSQDLVPAGDAPSLAGRICEVLADPNRLSRMAARNLEVARSFRTGVLRPRRDAFLRHVRAATEAWVEERKRTLPWNERVARWTA